jgi:hypothetical protein
MTKLRNVLAGALFALALATLNANALPSDKPAGLSTSQPVAGYCWVYYMGRWIPIPC